ncbi:MAG TPA: hypothetical protein VJK51_03585 [Candidatus Nanoarchaeia archaeon]|nr:hypothetical protein [Candidatus Nanoarchaeia archaeon]
MPEISIREKHYLKVYENARLIFVGGVSAAGKSTLCNLLYEKYDVENRRLHHYALDFAKETNVPNIDENWDILANIGMFRLGNEVVKQGKLSCDIHFAVQPNLDTAYATGREFKEDINETYIRGLSRTILQGLSGQKLSLYFLLLNCDSSSILQRRSYELESLGKKPRSLDILSIEKELFYEERYFYETLEDIPKEIPVFHKTTNNKNGKISDVLRDIISFVGLT